MYRPSVIYIDPVSHFTLNNHSNNDISYLRYLRFSLCLLSLSPWNSGSKQIPTPSVRGEVFEYKDAVRVRSSVIYRSPCVVLVCTVWYTTNYLYIIDTFYM